MPENTVFTRSSIRSEFSEPTNSWATVKSQSRVLEASLTFVMGEHEVRPYKNRVLLERLRFIRRGVVPCAHGCDVRLARATAERFNLEQQRLSPLLEFKFRLHFNLAHPTKLTNSSIRTRI